MASSQNSLRSVLGHRREHVHQSDWNHRSERSQISSNLHAWKRIDPHSVQTTNIPRQDPSDRTQDFVESICARTNLFRRGKELQREDQIQADQSLSRALIRIAQRTGSNPLSGRLSSRRRNAHCNSIHLHRIHVTHCRSNDSLYQWREYAAETRLPCTESSSSSDDRWVMSHPSGYDDRLVPCRISLHGSTGTSASDLRSSK
jgi:hypothetical protein